MSYYIHEDKTFLYLFFIFLSLNIGTADGKVFSNFTED